jgi:hypothetical protein
MAYFYRLFIESVPGSGKNGKTILSTGTAAKNPTLPKAISERDKLNNFSTNTLLW